MQKLAIEYLLKTKDLFPNKIAIVDGEQSITFFELWRKSLALAYWVSTEFQITNQPISVNLQKSIDAIVALLAIQLTGNIYVPLARIFHEKEMANPFQAYKIRLNANSKKGIRRDRLYTHPTRFPRFQTS